MSQQWYFGQNGTQSGPITQENLAQLIKSGRLVNQDLVWREGMAEWMPIGAMPEFAALAPQVAAAPLAGGPVGHLDYYRAEASVHYVGFWWRVLAYFIDAVLLGVAGAIIGAIFGVIMAAAIGTNRNATTMIDIGANVIGLILGWLYYAFMESSSRQASLGKMAIGAKVTDLDGRALSFGRASGRHFGKILSGLILGVGFIMVGVTERKQGLHDQLAGTLVVTK